MKRMYRTGCTFLLATTLAGMAVADVQVSVTLTGDLDEMLGILRQLQRMGYGGGEYDEDPLRLRVHSTHQTQQESVMLPPDAETIPLKMEAAPEPPPKPVIALNTPTVEPTAAAPGSAVWVTVQVIDMENSIDTLSATLNAADVTADLFDNGQNGDIAAGDGIWSAMLPLPPELSPGQYEVKILAFDANGAPILTLTADQRVTQLSAVIPFTITPPPAP